MEKNDLDWLDQDKIIRYRFIVFDPLRKDYPPSLDMKTNTIPSEKRFAIQEINVKIKDGTFISIPVSCEKCTLLAPAKEMIISYQERAPGADTSKTVKVFENQFGESHGLSCVNPFSKRRGNCPMLWNIFFIKNGVKIPYDPALAGPSSLISDVNQEGFKVAGWNDSQFPGGTTDWIEAYLDPVTKRYKVIIEIRYYN